MLNGALRQANLEKYLSTSSTNTSHKIFSYGAAADAEIGTQNASFKDNQPGQMDSRGHVSDHTRDLGFMSDTQLSNFFSRPIKLYETEWDVNSALFDTFDPWTIFWENLRNEEKIKHYYLLKCKMHIKILINGNAFYYGRAIAAYEPLDFYDDTSITNSRTPYIDEDLVRLSQRMHIYINPTTSEGGSLELPFFYHKNAFSIPNNDWRRMGRIVLMSLNNLQNANGATDPLNITVMGWAEDVKYAIPCGNIPEMWNEPEMDEHEDGVVSRPASTIANVASKLTQLPWIGRFARATEIGAGATAAVAKLFGFSSPNELSYSAMMPLVRPSLATVDNKYPAQKLTVDSKQEITIDPETTGISAMDELSIKGIAGRESYLTSFTWEVGDAPETSLFQCLVSPSVHRYESTTGPQMFHFPACAAAALPFSFWRGTMRFRFQIVASEYHKGRIRVVYDPEAGQLTPNFNTHYITIHDIASEKDFTVDVGWAQEYSWAPTLLPGTDTFVTDNSTVVSGLDGNGVLSVHVLNALTIPGATVANIQVNVFVSMLDDFEVAQPSDTVSLVHFRPDVSNTPEMGEEMENDMDCCEDPVSDPPTIDNMAMTQIEDPDVNKLFFGEIVGSFRQLLKRDYLAEVTLFPQTAETQWVQIRRGLFPMFGGKYTGPAPITSTALLTYGSSGDILVPAATTMLNYVARMFLAWRGSVRWTFDTSPLHVQGGAGERYSSVSYHMSRIPFTAYTNTTASADASNNNAVQVGYLNRETRPTAYGMHIGNTNVNPLQSVEVPYYSRKRFDFTLLQEDFTTNVTKPSFEFATLVPANTTAEEEIFIRSYCSAGEDMNFFFFNGLQPFYFYQIFTRDNTP
jgi:hypothetical protein